MSEPAKIGQTPLPPARFRLYLKMTAWMVRLRSFKRALFCRAFGIVFKRIVCALPRSDCSNCLLRENFLDAACFEPQPRPDIPVAAKFSSTPPPFMLNPPLTDRQAFHPGGTPRFDLVLMAESSYF